MGYEDNDNYAAQQDVYDIVHSYHKNYAKETEKLLKRVRGAIGRNPDSWLDVACGTGHHLEALHHAGVPRLAGLDSSPTQVAGAKQRLAPFDIDLELADMRNFSFNGEENFDVVSCLFSSVGHLESNDDYLRALQRMAAHLKPKGVVIVEPWIAAEDFVPGRVDAEVFVHGPAKIVRITKHCLGDNPNFCELEFRFVVSEKDNAVIKDWTTTLQLRLRSVEEQLQLFNEVFNRVEFQSTGAGSRGVFIARKPKTTAAKP